MGHKRKLTEHQKQIRFIMYLVGAVLVVTLVVMILVLNRPVGGYHH